MSESTQKKLDRVRPPRVQITYDVEIGNAIERKELPFVVGVMADLSAKRAEPLPKLKDRKFVEIDRDNFNDVMASAAPRVAFQVPNRLANDDSKINVELAFSEMDDLEPLALIKQIKPLAKLFEARQRLNDLLGKLDGNDELDGLLSQIVANSEQQDELKSLVAALAEAKGDAAEADASDEKPTE